MVMLRSCAKLLALICLTWQFCANGWAQNYPAKIVRYVVTDSAGGLADALGRIVAAGLTEVFGQQVIVENRTGAGGNIATAFAAKAPADGYTVLQVSPTHTANVTYYRNLSYDLVRDFLPLSLITSTLGALAFATLLAVGVSPLASAQAATGYPFGGENRFAGVRDNPGNTFAASRSHKYA